MNSFSTTTTKKKRKLLQHTKPENRYIIIILMKNAMRVFLGSFKYNQKYKKENF